MKRVVLLLLAIAVGASPARAQGRPTVDLTAENPARWDAAGLTGWFGGNKEEQAADWNDWYDAASFSASAGYYWTPHLKLDLDFATTTEGTVFVEEQFLLPGAPFPLVRYGEHGFIATTASAAALYQFFDNLWFHPFAGGGVEAIRERSRVTLQEQPVCVRGPCTPIALPGEINVSYAVRPFATVGFKLYVSERAFIRSDVQTTFSTRGVETARWRAGMGVDF
jgi:hypothetical protein